MNSEETYNHSDDLYYTRHGKGLPIVLVHGFAASNYDWIYLKPELVENGFQVYAPDLIGHGNNTPPTEETAYTFDLIYEHFSEWITSQEFDPETTLIGHSMGGLVTLNYAIQNPDQVNKLILINPYYTKDQLNRLLKYISGYPAPYRKALQITPSWLIQTILSLDIRGYIHYEDRARIQKAKDVSRAAPEIVFIPGTIPQVSNRLTEIEIPTLVIWGTKDKTLNPNYFPELAEKLPSGRSAPINGAGHQPHLSDSNLLNRIVLDFLGNQEQD
jgi:pimeloyl-ACP methyl ester carboxylesterase